MVLVSRNRAGGEGEESASLSWPSNGEDISKCLLWETDGSGYFENAS